MSESRLSAIPNAFYDLIVFVTPTLVLGAGIAIGVNGTAWVGEIDLGELKAIEAIATAFIVVLLSYEYGRIAEAWSAVLVQRPLIWLNGKIPFMRSADFCRLHEDAYSYFGLSGAPQDRKGDKWVIYFYAFCASPALGSDLLKRYAWEKLARNSAFTYAILLTGSLVVALLDLAGLAQGPVGSDGFGSPAYSLAAAALTVVAYGEYYKRNVWNYDLLTRTSPVLLSAGRGAFGGGSSVAAPSNSRNAPRDEGSVTH
ncbi:MAG TPA: hypothetical protein VH012_02210 [Acidimicrobiales bacterium]|jgi:hypothetical protein|nr:hypothetical protein [Acidimicrobiales bacterium]